MVVTPERTTARTSLMSSDGEPTTGMGRAVYERGGNAVDDGFDDLGAVPLPADTIGLLEGIASTRTIRRYHDEPVPPEAPTAILFALPPAPSAPNRPPVLFLVL